MTPATRQQLNHLLCDAQRLIAAEPVSEPPPAFTFMEPRRVWPEVWPEVLPDCWRGGLATGEALIEKALSDPRWFERLVKSLTEPLAETISTHVATKWRRDQAKQDRAIAVRLLEAFYEREAVGA